ncbi:type IV pilus assembly PilZ [Hyphomicrobium denitrificans 1NES1]|uniref:Type IV pilus assembly PilZ n=1 Tax=Hyphomicrobium denitrificans 1NES1 TaxID=670307 RepID=N0BBM4_9HYPH|nr:PilZ domain-containing protein [Hyphomicrobium denitrificans]AGK57500.1 type IV pilus assembly PilZ [Hyphomicrobium denitrificans 1NES1]
MHNPSISGHFLRRRDERRSVQVSAIAECHGISRAIEVVDFSNAGLRIDKVTGLATGDRLTISFTPDVSVEGTIVWLVWHKAGLQFTRPLKQDDPAYRFLMDRAALIEQAHVRAISILAQQEALKARESDPT